MTVIGALSSFRELGKMSPHKRASVCRTDQLSDGLKLAGRGSGRSRTMPIPSKGFRSRCNRPSNPSAENRMI